MHSATVEIHDHIDRMEAGVVIPCCNLVNVQYVRNLVVHTAMDGRKDTA